MQLDTHTLKWLKDKAGIYPMETDVALSAFEDAINSEYHQFILMYGVQEKILHSLGIQCNNHKELSYEEKVPVKLNILLLILKYVLLAAML